MGLEVKEFQKWLEAKNRYSDDWIEKAVDKYRRGIIEHSSELPLTREQCLEEYENELYDLEGYSFKLTKL